MNALPKILEFTEFFNSKKNNFLSIEDINEYKLKIQHYKFKISNQLQFYEEKYIGSQFIIKL